MKHFLVVLAIVFAFGLLAGCADITDPIGKCPRSKLLLNTSAQQYQAPDNSDQYYGVLGYSWSKLEDPVPFWTDNLKNQNMTLHYSVYDSTGTGVLIGEFTLPLRQGNSPIAKEMLWKWDFSRIDLWSVSECGALSTHKLRFIND